jgi:glutathione synthase/RimK-type ligase-like ATP-grasp enzyme
MNEGSTTEWIDISGNDAESLEAKIVNLALKGAAAVRIAFASVDIFMKKDGELIISEVNSTVGVDHLIDHHGEEGYRKIYAVYEKALTYLIASDK